MSSFSFKLGFAQIKMAESKEVRNKLMLALGISTRQAWSKRLKGQVEPKMSEIQAVEMVFAEYGIAEIWGDPDAEVGTTKS